MEALLYLYILHVVGVTISSSINCPQNETEWIARSKTILCQGSDVYHCLLLEDGKSRKEKCIEKTLILQGHCPIFTKNDYLHWKTCNASGCPDTPFRSDEVYKYPICYGRINEEANDGQNNGLGNQPITDNSNVPLKISIAAIAVLLALALVLFLVWNYRKRKMKCFPGRRNSNEESDHEFQPLDPNPDPNPSLNPDPNPSLNPDPNPSHNPDPNLKDEFIIKGIEILNNKNVLYLIGHLGNSVSTTGKQVAEDFANQKMDCKCWNYLKFSKSDVKSNSVNFIDGWGGLWNENPCEKEETLKTLETVAEISNSRNDVKFVIGICSKLHHAHENEFRRHGILMEDDETLVLDTMSKYKRDKLKEEIQQNLCTNEQCECQSLEDKKLSEIQRADNNVRIGRYLIVKLISINHDLISDFRHDGPLVAMRKHFEELLEGNQDLSWMIYTVCKGYYDENDLGQEILNAFNISIDTFSSRKDIDKYAKRINKKVLAPMWSSKIPCNSPESQESKSEEVYVFRHNFLYICAFHALYNKNPDEIMRVCIIDAILQLVRPGGHSVEPFTIQADDKHIDIFCKRIEKNVDVNTWAVHPLIKHWKTNIRRTKK